MKYSKTLFKFLLVSVCFFLISQNLFAQENQTADTNQSQSVQITENTPLFQNTATTNDENNINLYGDRKSSSVWPFVKMILILILLVVAIFAIWKFVTRNVNKTRTNDEFLRKVASISLMPGKTVEVVSLLDHAYILGVSDAGINLLAEVSDKELIDAMNLYADKNRNISKPRNFTDVLNLFMGNKSNGNVFEGSESKMADMIKNQRTKLNDGE